MTKSITKTAIVLLLAMFAGSVQAHDPMEYEPEEEEHKRRSSLKKDNDRFCVHGLDIRPNVSRKSVSQCNETGGQIKTRRQIQASDNSDLKDALKSLRK